MKQICGELLRAWCEKLLKLQVREIEDPALRGGILCPACGFIHGRCFDAIYPFLYLADTDQDERFLEGAKLLFAWAEHAVSREDGSYVNDGNSQWKGTTVFSVIQLIEALTLHGHLLDQELYESWRQRIRKAADFLYGFSEFEICNVNYRIANSLAMELCAEFFGEEKYRIRGEELADLTVRQLTADGLLFGEGRPTDGMSPRGCRSVDIGYNMEESLPVLLQYAIKIGNVKLQDKARLALKYHLRFMLDDGGMDNSFGTRNYKWTYWGSRTSDGCTLGCLLAADKEPDLGIAAYRNLQLLKACTYEGILYGGPHIRQIGEKPCIHHTFSHAKVLAGVLDQGLQDRLCEGQLPRSRMQHTEYVKELDTCFVSAGDYTATVTAYDWEYTKLPGGHAGGGTLSLLWHKKAGPVLCAGMSCYSLKEPNNMQLPRYDHHQCITPRLEYTDGTNEYSNLFDDTCRMCWNEAKYGTVVEIFGCLTSFRKKQMEQGTYQIRYTFEAQRVHMAAKVCADVSGSTRWILPVVSCHEEAVIQEHNRMIIRKAGCQIIFTTERGVMKLPCGEKRIYNLVPGVEALRVDVEPEMGEVAFCLSFCYD